MENEIIMLKCCLCGGFVMCSEYEVESIEKESCPTCKKSHSFEIVPRNKWDILDFEEEKNILEKASKIN